MDGYVAHGKCVKGQCICNEGWTFEDCSVMNVSATSTPAPPIEPIPTSTSTPALVEGQSHLTLAVDIGSRILRVQSILGFAVSDEIMVSK